MTFGGRRGAWSRLARPDLRCHSPRAGAAVMCIKSCRCENRIGWSSQDGSDRASASFAAAAPTCAETRERAEEYRRSVPIRGLVAAASPMRSGARRCRPRRRERRGRCDRGCAARARVAALHRERSRPHRTNQAATTAIGVRRDPAVIRRLMRSWITPRPGRWHRNGFTTGGCEWHRAILSSRRSTRTSRRIHARARSVEPGLRLWCW